MAWVSEFFYKESKSEKKGKKIFFVFCVGEGVVSDFYYKESKYIHFFFGGGGGGGGMERVVWRGDSVARVSELFLQIIQISNKQVSSS